MRHIAVGALYFVTVGANGTDCSLSLARPMMRSPSRVSLLAFIVPGDFAGGGAHGFAGQLHVAHGSGQALPHLIPFVEQML